MDVFVRSEKDYSNASYLGGGLWGGEIDEIIVVGTRVRPYDNSTSIQDLLREWRSLEEQAQLVQLIQEMEQYQSPEDCSELLGLADFFRDAVHELEARVGADEVDEWGNTIVYDNGDLSFFNGFYTDGLATEVGHRIPFADRPRVISVVHNHPRQGNLNADINLHNRYPSPDDWSAADQLVATGTNPDTFSLTVVDPFGAVRVFSYVDRALYTNLSDDDMENGVNLPGDIPEDADMASCVTL